MRNIPRVKRRRLTSWNMREKRRQNTSKDIITGTAKCCGFFGTIKQTELDINQFLSTAPSVKYSKSYFQWNFR